MPGSKIQNVPTKFHNINSGKNFKKAPAKIESVPVSAACTLVILTIHVMINLWDCHIATLPLDSW